jgi:hypothetical protein
VLGAGDGQGVGVEVYVLPAEAQQFPPSQSGVDGDCDQGLEPVREGSEEGGFLGISRVAGPGVVFGEQLDGFDRVLRGLPVSDRPIEDALEGGYLPVTGRGGHLLKPLGLVAFKQRRGDLRQGPSRKVTVESAEDGLIALVGSLVSSGVGQEVPCGLLERDGALSVRLPPSPPVLLGAGN